MENEEKVLIKWVALERPHKRWSKDFYSTVMVLAFLASVILFFIEGLTPVVVVWAVVFLMWAINRTEPQEMEYQLTNWGVRMRGDLYRYEEMYIFWFEDKWNQRLMRLLTSRFPGQLILVIPADEEETIKKYMVEKVLFEVPKPSWSDRLVKWFGEKVPLG